MFEDVCTGEAGGGDGGERSGVPAHPLLAHLSRLSSMAGQVQEWPTLSLTQGEVEDALVAIHGLRSQIEAGYFALLRAREDTVAGGGGVTGSHAHTAGWAADRLHLSPGAAKADLLAAYAVDPSASPGVRVRQHGGRLTQLGQEFSQGRVSREHVDNAVTTLTRIPSSVLKTRGVEVDAILTDHALRYCPADARTLARHLLQVLDPGGGENGDQRAYEDRGVDLKKGVDGSVHLEGALDPVGGATFTKILDWISDPSRGEEMAAVRAGGDTEGVLPRHRGQVVADGIVTMAHLAASAIAHEYPAAESARLLVVTTPEQITHTPTDPDPRDGFTAATRAAIRRADAASAAGLAGDDAATVGHDGSEGSSEWCPAGRTAGLATCDGLGPISARTLHTLACDATMDRVIINRAGAVVSLHTIARPATRAMRRALTARDGGCAFPGCSAPASWCDAHHVVYWSRGGATAIENLCLLCRRHHSKIHQERWTIQMVDAVPWFLPPRDLDPARTPRRNTVHSEIDHVRRTAQALLHDLDLPTRRPPSRCTDQPGEPDTDTKPRDSEKPGDSEAPGERSTA